MDVSPDDELASRICVALMRLGTRMAVGFDQQFASSGLTQAQFRVMTAVWNIGGPEGATPSALSEYLFIERATVSVLLKRMIAAGLLARRAERDRRSYRVRITAKGGSVLTAVLPRARAVADEILAGMSVRDQRRFERYLMRTEERLRAGDAR
ncbi:MAG: MarR family transcriptional regulator [Gemmatimonadaceae bacterium]|jgi:DNA-binding MarR family transcriptional regulator|nr:MarR family transcriptional regulator [Gemmatimonadaceae bacterium]